MTHQNPRNSDGRMPGRARILGKLNAVGPMTIRDLTVLTGESGPRVVQLISDLERMNLVEPLNNEKPVTWIACSNVGALKEWEGKPVPKIKRSNAAGTARGIEISNKKRRKPALPDKVTSERLDRDVAKFLENGGSIEQLSAPPLKPTGRTQAGWGQSSNLYK